MKRPALLIAVGGVAALGIAWALFRPELLFINRSVSESFPVVTTSARSGADPTLLLEGRFTGLAHETKGSAAVYQLANGSRVLRLKDFETSNGPDVHVLLVKAASAPDDDTVKRAGSVDLGSLKGNIGDQNYEVPAGLDLAAYRSVSIWCNRFNVNFGSASLATGSPVSPSAAPVRVSSGAFHSVAHETKGMASVYRLPDGQRVLRLTGFETSNGPDVRVLLVAAADASDNDSVTAAPRVELGALKGNVGDQNYDIPANVDLSKFKAVTIWCNRFGVNFGTAPLSS
jgi:hypothetical protein